jgi:hypothetical protein
LFQKKAFNFAKARKYTKIAKNMLLNFRTAVPISPAPFSMTHKHRFMSVGSCFSEHIGRRLSIHKFDTLTNPFGILFNPVSILDALQMLTRQQLVDETQLFEHNSRWHSFLHHGRFSDADKKTCLDGINTAIAAGAERLRNADFLILTFGTAHVFEYRKTGRIVANCHKLPNDDFERKRLSVAEIVAPYLALLPQLKALNPALRVLLTVSPVRHLRDGLVENQRSKATLILATDELAQAFDFVEYFPAYELLTDDLRDYRFYADDLIHPSQMAIDYIWQAFAQRYFSAATQQLNTQFFKLEQAKNHRSENPAAPEYQHFLRTQIEKIKRWQTQYPNLDFKTDLAFFNG